MTGAISSWEHVFEQMPGVGAAVNYMLAVATDDDLYLIDALAEDSELDDVSKAAVRAVAASLRGDPGPLAVLAPSLYVDDVNELVDHIAEVVSDLGDAGLTELLGTRQRLLTVPAALKLIDRDHLDPGHLTSYLKLNDRQVDAALSKKAADNADLCTEIVGILRKDKDLDDGDERASKFLAATCSQEDLEKLMAAEPYGQVLWEALLNHDPEGMVSQAREVLDDQAAFLKEKVAPLQGEYEPLAEYIVAISKRAACSLLAQREGKATAEERSADLDRAICELRRENFRSRHAALSAVVALVDEATADRVPVETIDGYWVTDHLDSLLASPLATRVVAVWRESSVSQLRRTANTWMIRQPERTDAELEEALFDDDARVRMAALDALVIRWSREQLIDLLDQYDQQGRPYWYNVIAALDENLFGWDST